MVFPGRHRASPRPRWKQNGNVLWAGVASPLPPIFQDWFASREIWEALKTVSREGRAALVIVGIEGFSYAEAATMLGIPAGTLMSRVARGREELRGLLDDVARRSAIRVVER